MWAEEGLAHRVHRGVAHIKQFLGTLEFGLGVLRASDGTVGTAVLRKREVEERHLGCSWKGGCAVRVGVRSRFVEERVP